MVVALVALFVSLGGGAYALKGKNTVDSGDIINNQVKGKDVKDASLTGKDVKDGSVTGADVADGSVGTADLANGAVGAAQIHSNSIGAAQLGPGSVGTSEVSDGSIGTADLQNNGVKGADIDESSLSLSAAQVPGTARPFGAVLTAGSSKQMISLGGLQIAVTCFASNTGAQLQRTNPSGYVVRDHRAVASTPAVFTGTATGVADYTISGNQEIDERYTFLRDSDSRVSSVSISLITQDTKVGDGCLAVGYGVSG